MTAQICIYLLKMLSLLLLLYDVLVYYYYILLLFWALIKALNGLLYMFLTSHLKILTKGKSAESFLEAVW